jgi:hypothetical protein
MDYRKDVRIDENSLDIEWLEQSELAIRYGEYWSQCKEEFTRAEEYVKVITAELSAMANENPDKYLGKGIKATGANVEAFYRKHPKHKEAKERWIKAMREMNDAEIVKNEISFTRKSALENLVKLHGQNYFAGPKVPRNLHDEKEKRNLRRKDNNAKVRRIRKS